MPFRNDKMSVNDITKIASFKHLKSKNVTFSEATESIFAFPNVTTFHMQLKNHHNAYVACAVHFENKIKNLFILVPVYTWHLAESY